MQVSKDHKVVSCMYIHISWLFKYITSMLTLPIPYNLIIWLFISRLAVAKQKKQKTLVLQLSSKAFVRMLHMLGFWKKCPIENFFIWPDFFSAMLP